jgi:cell wall-associated NlpC family hydrolase
VSYTLTEELQAAQSWLGVPYLFGGTTRAGVDCSGLTQAVAAECGTEIPRTSEAQYAELPVGTGAVGELVFFDVPTDFQPQPAHVGIVYAWPDWMVNAPYTGTVVRVDPIAGPGRSVMGYRIIPGLVVPKPPTLESDEMPFLTTYKGSYWVVAGDLSSARLVATPADGSNLYANGYKIIPLSAAQMAAIVG